MSETLRSQDAQLPIRLENNYATPGARGSSLVPVHVHPEVELFFLRQGRAAVTLDTIVHHLESDQCICALGGIKHSVCAETPGELFFYDTLHIDLKSLMDGADSWCQSYYRKIYNHSIPMQFVVDALKPRGESLYTALGELLVLLQTKPAGYELGCTAYLNLVLFSLLTLSDQNRAIETCEDDRLRPAYAYIEANYMHKIGIDILAGLCSMSKYHFIRVFHSQNGQTPVEYINSLRIEKACDMLRGDDDQKVLTIALSAGFNDLSNFNRLFKRSVGMTPAEYRRQARLKQSEDAAMYYKECLSDVPFYSFML